MLLLSLYRCNNKRGIFRLLLVFPLLPTTLVLKSFVGSRKTGKQGRKSPGKTFLLAVSHVGIPEKKKQVGATLKAILGLSGQLAKFPDFFFFDPLKKRESFIVRYINGDPEISDQGNPTFSRLFSY